MKHYSEQQKRISAKHYRRMRIDFILDKLNTQQLDRLLNHIDRVYK